MDTQTTLCSLCTLLQTVLGVPLQRLLVVLGSHPQLILGPTHRVVDQLQVRNNFLDLLLSNDMEPVLASSFPLVPMFLSMQC
jgi:hypothetical protein